jgi:hypothetical protein
VPVRKAFVVIKKNVADSVNDNLLNEKGSHILISKSFESKNNI